MAKNDLLGLYINLLRKARSYLQLDWESHQFLLDLLIKNELQREIFLSMLLENSDPPTLAGAL